MPKTILTFIHKMLLVVVVLLLFCVSECQLIVRFSIETKCNTVHNIKQKRYVHVTTTNKKWEVFVFPKAENPSFRNQLSSCPCTDYICNCMAVRICLCVTIRFIKWCVIIQFLTTQHVNKLTPKTASELVYCIFLVLHKTLCTFKWLQAYCIVFIDACLLLLLSLFFSYLLYSLSFGLVTFFLISFTCHPTWKKRVQTHIGTNAHTHCRLFDVWKCTCKIGLLTVHCFRKCYLDNR